MADAEALIRQFLNEGRVMQIATLHDGRPWICTVYYVADDQQRLYWLSLPGRQHSRDIAADNRIAVAIAVKLDQPVIGLQAEGTAEAVTDPQEVAAALKRYVERYKVGGDFYNNFIAGKNQHVLYRCTPSQITLFDERDFSKEAARYTWILAK